VITGTADDVQGSVREIAADPTYLDVFVPANTSFNHPIPAGHVTDPSGAVVPQAKIELRDAGTGAVRTTTRDQVSLRCGAKAKARQTRWTLALLRPQAVAGERVLQCVAFPGADSKVIVNTRSTSASLSRRGIGRPVRISSFLITDTKMVDYLLCGL